MFHKQSAPPNGVLRTLSRYSAGLLTLLSLVPMVGWASAPLTLEQTIQLAQANDPWFEGNRHKQQATLALSRSAGTLPDPTVSVGLLNLPSDSWEFNQEPMTQLKVGVSQMFPRGDTLEIQQDKLQIQSRKYDFLRLDRLAMIKAQVSQLWLDVYLAQQKVTLIEQDTALFEQMVDIANANYASASGSTRQQDVIRAQLERIQLQDRLTQERQNLAEAQAQLAPWLRPFDYDTLTTPVVQDAQLIEVPTVLPSLSISVQMNRLGSTSELAQRIFQHPALLAIDIDEQASSKEIDLAKQQYKPKWGVNASYAYRDDAPNGSDRADFFSLGVTVELPLFGNERQDQQVTASIASSQAIKTEKRLLAKTMLSNIEQLWQKHLGLTQRQKLYADSLLTQLHDQAEAALTAYTNDDGGFAEVVRARIAELNAKLAALQIDVDVLKTQTRLNYYFTTAETSHVD